MKNLNVLIKELKAEASQDWAIKYKVADMYHQDAKDATTAGKLIKSNLNEAAEFISLLDTSIREAIIIAIAQDKGNDWVEQNLGWSVR